MTVGPYGGSFGGTPYDPTAQAPTTTQATRPQSASMASSLVAGTQRVVFNPGPSSIWLVRRMVVLSDTPGECHVYVGPVAPENMVSGTYSGDFDENDANQPYLVPEASDLTFVWPSGGACRARIEYDEVSA